MCPTVVYRLVQDKLVPNNIREALEGTNRIKQINRIKVTKNNHQEKDQNRIQQELTELRRGITVELFFLLHGDFLDFFLSFMYCIQHYFICLPSDFTVSEDAGIKPRTVATSALAVRRSNH